MLEEMVQAAISQKMTLYCLTEHMPRGPEDLYPEEAEIGKRTYGHTSKEQTSRYLFQLFDDYYTEAKRLQTKYASNIKLLVGMEIDWIRPSSKDFIQSLLQKYHFDLFVGSVHHVHTCPIDYTSELFEEARACSGGSEEKLFEDYFDLQYEMLQALRPPIVGHFDLIRLKSRQPDASFKQSPGVWSKIVRNLEYTIRYGGLVEINTAGLRKDLDEPYPKAEICQEVVQRGGLVTLSDDAHGVDQVGTNYRKAIDFAHKAGVKSIACLIRGRLAPELFTDVEKGHYTLDDLYASPYFKK